MDRKKDFSVLGTFLGTTVWLLLEVVPALFRRAGRCYQGARFLFLVLLLCFLCLWLRTRAGSPNRKLSWSFISRIPELQTSEMGKGARFRGPDADLRLDCTYP